MIRFLANENIPLRSIHLLREQGYDISAITEDAPGISDRRVLERARQEERIILTFDRDYGELIFRYNLPAPVGVLYLRFDPSTPEEAAEYVLNLLSLPEITLDHKFTVAEREHLRQRSLPS